ncbi:TPA: tail fiber domain-containing protein, partial [Streptococcus pneumoniae]
ANKANADSQFANVTNQLARKVETTDFQRVKETSKLYERILGNTENGIADKVARMALTNQLFQVEVGKYSVSGPNLIKNSDFKNSTNEWGSTQNLGRLVKHSFYHNGQKDLMRLSNATKNENFLYSHRFNLERNTDAEKLKVDNALIRKLTANDAFIDQLISKRIFSTKVESVISSSTFLEAYQGRIGGFTLGQFDQGGGRWISGVNQFSVGMGNGAGYGVRTAFWANWGNNWNYAGPKAWNVNTDGKMYCRNEVGFYDQVDFSNSSRANFYGNTTFSRSPVFSNGIELGSKDVLGDGWNPKGGRNAVVWWNQVGSGSLKYWMEQKSDRRLKENITDTAVKALDKINRLRMVAFDFIENKKHEEIGLIAQEAETIVPRIVSRDPENPDGYLHIDYTALVPYLIKAIQELNQKIEKMEKTIA